MTDASPKFRSGFQVTLLHAVHPISSTPLMPTNLRSAGLVFNPLLDPQREEVSASCLLG